jgi:hypothetical protein
MLDALQLPNTARVGFKRPTSYSTVARAAENVQNECEATSTLNMASLQMASRLVTVAARTPVVGAVQIRKLSLLGPVLVDWVILRTKLAVAPVRSR